MTRSTILEINGLTKKFGDSVALDGIDVTVSRGTLHALLGGNGSGKSTTVKILAGVYTQSDGTIEVEGMVEQSQWAGGGSRPSPSLQPWRARQDSASCTRTWD